MNTASSTNFDRQYQTHLKHLKLKGLQPKTIEAYSRAIRRIGKRFEGCIDDLTKAQLTGQFHCKSVGSGEKALIYLGRYSTAASSLNRTSSPATTAG